MDNITNFFFTQGILGIIVVVQAYVIIKLYNKSERQQDRIVEEKEARRLDAVETRTDVTSILPGISQSLQNISDKIEISKESRR